MRPETGDRRPETTGRELVFTFHGIHNGQDTFGDIYRDWLVRHSTEFHCVEINYGRITGTQMYGAKLWPWCMSERRTRAALRMSDAWASHGAPTRHAIAHSYGTQFITDLLWQHPYIKLDGLILVGSVLEERFHSTRLPRLIVRGQITRILNVWSRNDSVIRHWSRGPYGTAGSTGFIDLTGQEPVWQNETEEEHGTYFWSEFRNEHFTRWTQWLGGES